MKIKLLRKRQSTGFTLIEMIGVLAVIAILAALLIPKIFEAINNARINNACISLDTVKTALADHYAKFGSIAYNGNTPAVINLATPANGDNFDSVLLQEGFIDKLLETKIADNAAGTMVRLRAKNATATTAPTAVAATDDDPYNLDNATPNNDTPGAVVCEAVLTGVTEADARELSLRLDGASLSTAIGTSDLVGRVKYVSANPTTVLIYLTHR